MISVIYKKKNGSEIKIQFEPGEYILNKTLICSDFENLCGDIIISPTFGALDEQLRRHHEPLGH